MPWFVELVDQRRVLQSVREEWPSKSAAFLRARDLAAVARALPGFCVAGSPERGGYTLRPDGSAWVEVAWRRE